LSLPQGVGGGGVVRGPVRPKLSPRSRWDGTLHAGEGREMISVDAMVIEGVRGRRPSGVLWCSCPFEVAMGTMVWIHRNFHFFPSFPFSFLNTLRCTILVYILSTTGAYQSTTKVCPGPLPVLDMLLVRWSAGVYGDQNKPQKEVGSPPAPRRDRGLGRLRTSHLRPHKILEVRTPLKKNCRSTPFPHATPAPAG